MKKTLGVLGGMGPMATADFFTKVVELTKASSDNEHIRVLIDNYPQLPDRQSHILHGKTSPAPQMIEAVKNLMALGADYIAMPCNTAHYFADEIEKATGCKLIHILKVNALAARNRFGTDKKVGILATSGVLQSGIYANAFKEQGIDSVTTTQEEQKVMIDLIFGIKGGKYPETADGFVGILNAMKARGADYFVLGCTELPLAVQHFALQEQFDFIDTTYELAKASVLACGYELND